MVLLICAISRQNYYTNWYKNYSAIKNYFRYISYVFRSIAIKFKIHPKTFKYENDSNKIQSYLDVINICTQVISTSYSGNPTCLQNFIECIELLETIISDSNTDILRQFILSRLEAKARLAVINNSDTIQDIKNSLLKNIKPYTHNYVESLLKSVNFDYNNIVKWSVKMEKLSFSYEFALVYEGCSTALATKLTAELILKICLKLTTSDFVFVILKSSHFDDAKEVLAKFISATLDYSNLNPSNNFIVPSNPHFVNINENNHLHPPKQTRKSKPNLKQKIIPVKATLNKNNNNSSNTSAMSNNNSDSNLSKSRIFLKSNRCSNDNSSDHSAMTKDKSISAGSKPQSSFNPIKHSNDDSQAQALKLETNPNGDHSRQESRKILSELYQSELNLNKFRTLCESKQKQIEKLEVENTAIKACNETLADEIKSLNEKVINNSNDIDEPYNISDLFNIYPTSSEDIKPLKNPEIKINEKPDRPDVHMITLEDLFD